MDRDPRLGWALRLCAGRSKHILVDTYENRLEKLKRIDKARASHLYRRADREGQSHFTLIAE